MDRRLKAIRSHLHSLQQGESGPPAPSLTVPEIRQAQVHPIAPPLFAAQSASRVQHAEPNEDAASELNRLKMQAELAKLQSQLLGMQVSAPAVASAGGSGESEQQRWHSHWIEYGSSRTRASLLNLCAPAQMLPKQGTPDKGGQPSGPVSTILTDGQRQGPLLQRARLCPKIYLQQQQARQQPDTEMTPWNLRAECACLARSRSRGPSALLRVIGEERAAAAQYDIS